MLPIKKENKHFYTILLLSTVFLCYFYGPVLLAPNTYMFTPWADGLSQYFNFSAYVRHSSNYFENTGANYPYGEHIVFYDAQPFFGAVMRFWVGIFPSLGQYTVGVLNLLMLFCLWLTPLFLFGILKRLNVQPWLAVWGAMGITFLEPQVFRMLGHFSLSYSCAIPMTLYFMLRSFEGERPALWIGLLALFNSIWLFTHPYLGLMCCMITGAAWGFYWLRHLKILFKNKRSYLFPLIGFLLPIALFQLVVKLSDDHVAKSEDVYGVFAFCGEADDVFFPNHPPLKPFVEAFYGEPLQQTWEAWSYVGLTTILVFFVALIVWLKRRIFKPKNELDEASHPVVWTTFWATIPILLLSWAYPFIQYPELLDSLAVVRQFRSLGRFGWIFYYVTTICSIYLIHRAALRLEQMNLKPLGIALMILGPLLYMVEGYPHHLEVSSKVTVANNLFVKEHRPAKIQAGLDVIDPNKYQAILPLPMYYLGSGNFLKTPTGGTTQLAMVTSEATGLPTIAATISRGDVWESRNIMQTISPPFYPRKIQADMPSKKPFLITRSNEQEWLTRSEQFILDRATLIHKDERGNGFYEISYDDLFIDDRPLMLNYYESRKNTFVSKNDWLVSDPNVYLKHLDFEHLDAKHSMNGKGAYHALKTQGGEVAIIPTSPANDSIEVEYFLKYWIYNGEIDAMNYLHILIFGSNPENGAWEKIAHTRPDESSTIFGDWSLVETSFKAAPGQFKNLHVRAWSNIRSTKTFYIDDLILTDRACDYYKVLKTEDGRVSELIFNSHIIQKPIGQ